MVRTLRLIQEITSIMDEKYPAGWIESMDWSDENKSKGSYFSGKRSIDELENTLLTIFSKTVLQGDHLRFSSSGIDGLLNKYTYDIFDDTNKSKSSLQKRFQQVLQDLRTAIMLTKFHFSITLQLFDVSNSSKNILNFISIKPGSANDDSWVTILDTIIEVCFFEYRFSYDQNKIRDLLVRKAKLEKARTKKADKDVLMCIDCTISKVNLLLLKLSHFAKGKKIEYQFNFISTVVAPSDVMPLEQKEYANYLKFIDPNTYITQSDVYKWQTHPGNKWARLGQMVLLMRYYTKVSENVMQAQHLLSEYECFYKEKINTMFYEFNNYALRSVRVYMHNCLFSLKCKKHDSYNFESIMSEVEKIQMVQNECMIHNYHPFKKAVVYAIESIKDDIQSKTDKEILKMKLDLLRLWQSLYRENIDWCRQNQRYAFQLTFMECTEVGKNYKVFHPSSFSRPLKFKDIYKNCDEIELKISMIENEYAKYDEVLAIKEAQDKISNMERTNMQQMGLFVTLTTFLVGLLSIFIGNNGQVSIFEKMRYVIALALILIVFVCVGFFAMNDKRNDGNAILFWILLVISAASLLGICWTQG